ncbi:MAG TPA: DUF3179 domain-containing protein [Dehalococcoidia bacterium]|nr:DUF3179 domain-containing protein [Dehalococcoidia bacterium]
MDLREIDSGGPSRDGIPPLDKPSFRPVPDGDGFLTAVEPVIAFEHNGDARAYPLQILIWHEIVNDTVGGLPVTVTFCPLCNTAIVFDRTLDGRVLDFGTTGNLLDSDLVMYDRQTESWWQQFAGEAIVGELTGKQLTYLPAAVVSWAQFKERYPRGAVLSRDTGYDRPYGENPYAGYDNAADPPFLYNGSIDKRLLPKEHVVTVAINDEAVAYPFRVLQKAQVVNDTVDNEPIVIFWQKGTTSALDAEQIAKSVDIGSATAFSALLDGRRLTFQAVNGGFTDAESGSQWSVLGRATAGPLQGRQLPAIVHGTPFWFAAAVAYPKIRVYAP